MKKQSILNLVNSILLLATLLFSVISFAWYSPNKDVGTPLSFGAGDTGSAIEITKIMIDDENNKTLQEDIGAIGDASFLTTSINFGVIDDLGYLKQSNIVYYCLTIPVTSGTTALVNLSYTDTLFVTAEDETESNVAPGYHFNLFDGDGKILNTTFHSSAEAEEDFDEGITYLAYSCAVNDTPPENISASDLTGLFDATTEKPFSEPDYSPAEDDPALVNVSSSATTGSYYVYIKIYPDLDNYHELAQLLMDNMPFYVAFGTKLYIDLKPTYDTEVAGS